MAKVFEPTQLEGYYNSSSSKCRPPQQSYHTSFASSHPRMIFDRHDQYSSRPSNQSLYPPGSSGTVSPVPTEVVDSPLSSPLSSLASSIDLGENKSLNVDMDEPLFFPVYEYKSTPSLHYNTVNSANSNTAEYNEYQERDQFQNHIINALPIIELSLVGPADDSFVKEEPSRHVDYLSHDWKEEDIWASWRYMIGKRKIHSNAARLENASWRTWAKAKYQLKTVSPEKLNWLKDCDVTWLYGPLSTGAGKFSSISPVSPPVSPTEPKVSQTPSYKTKPILKKRSMSEVMLQRSLTTSSLLKQATAAIESQQLDTLKSPLRPSAPSRANSDITVSSQV